MIEYKYQKVKGLSGKKFLENGHTMFEEDVLQRLKRLAHLEEQIKQGQSLPIDIVVGQSEQLNAFVDWWHNLSQDELAWYEGRYVGVFLSL